MLNVKINSRLSDIAGYAPHLHDLHHAWASEYPTVQGMHPIDNAHFKEIVNVLARFHSDLLSAMHNSPNYAEVTTFLAEQV